MDKKRDKKVNKNEYKMKTEYWERLSREITKGLIQAVSISAEKKDGRGYSSRYEDAYHRKELTLTSYMQR